MGIYLIGTQRFETADEYIAYLERKNTALREALHAVVATDKTVYDYRGKAAQNRDGRVPDEGRWSTPREIARAALSVATSEERN